MLKFYVTVTQMLRNYLFNDKRGVTAIEYGLIAGLVAIVIIVALTNTGNSLNRIFEAISNAVGNAANQIN